MKTMDKWFIKAQTKMLKAEECVKEFFTSERGISNIAATVLLLSVVVLVVGLFWEQLEQWLKEMMEDIFSYKPETT